jgi:hypothetical protein
MLFIGTLDAILTLIIVIRQNLDHDAGTTGHILTDCRLEDYSVPDLEFWRHHSSLPCERGLIRTWIPQLATAEITLAVLMRSFAVA